MKYAIEYLPSALEDLKLSVKNYFVFYRIDETKKTVTVARVIYAKRNTASVETKDL